MHKLRQALLYADVIRRLGIQNVAYVAWYRFSIKSGLRGKSFPLRVFQIPYQFFRPTEKRTDYPDDWKAHLLDDASRIVVGRIRYYARHWKAVGAPPEWFLNPFNGAHYPQPRRHWTTLKDFHPKVGDIKNIWEASRFEWVVTLARAYAVSADTVYLQTLNRWIKDWATHNPVNSGPNWKCGQEASIRVFNLIQAALILKQIEHPVPLLKDFIERHLERIQANIRYAIAQDNNHGTSEAAALFIGGHWLAQQSVSSRQSRKAIFYGRQGRRWLENRVARLVEKDGSFSQHSVTYHRMLLDTLILVEYWRKHFKVAPFSRTFCERAAAALRWMAMFADPQSGKAPNLGANDGTSILNAHCCDYRDFRPSLQTASVLLNGRKMLAHGPWDESGYWLGLTATGIQAGAPQKRSKVLPGGYVIMAGRHSWAMLRYPMYRFRPSHNDAFHFDLWCRGDNICRDAGSYSYNPDDPADGSTCFSAVQAHNTVCFDGGQPMPRLGRFMLGRWLQPAFIGPVESLGNGISRWSGVYKDHRGNRHQRTVTWQADNWTIEDHLSGTFETARIRYRLMAAAYRIAEHEVIAPWGRIEVRGADCRIRMSTGYESLYYWHKEPVDVLVLDVAGNNTKIVTRFLLA